MLGFSVYLGTEISAQTKNYIQSMATAGFQGVFTSLHIPEDDVSCLPTRLERLATYCHDCDLQLVADISASGFKNLNWSPADPPTILASGVDGLRIDDGLDMSTIAGLSQVMPIALNASTFNRAQFAELKQAGADFEHIEAWHNYYPRPETGLARDWYVQQNNFLHELGIKTMGFVPGDGALRGPLALGLPTLEEQRGMHPLAAYMELNELGTDRVYIGDPGLRASTVASFTAYIHSRVIRLRVAGLDVNLRDRVWHNRADPARDAIRLQEGRRLQLLKTVAANTVARPFGSLTCDNDAYGRYAGELQITLRDLKANPAVNVLGRVVESDRDLLKYVGAGQGIRLVAMNS